MYPLGLGLPGVGIVTQRFFFHKSFFDEFSPNSLLFFFFAHFHIPSLFSLLSLSLFLLCLFILLLFFFNAHFHIPFLFLSLVSHSLSFSFCLYSSLSLFSLSLYSSV